MKLINHWTFLLFQLFNNCMDHPVQKLWSYLEYFLKSEAPSVSFKAGRKHSPISEAQYKPSQIILVVADYSYLNLRYAMAVNRNKISSNK
jgi:hypothetical protein